MQLPEFPSGILLNRSLPIAPSVENEYFAEEFLCYYFHFSILVIVSFNDSINWSTLLFRI